MEGGGAYGAGMATGHFDCSAYIKKPQVIVRFISLVFSVIVFGLISSHGYSREKCAFDDSDACSFGISVGVIAFIGLVGFLVLDALFDNISSVQRRKYVVIADTAFSGFWTFMWFVCFCYLTDKWSHSYYRNVHYFYYRVNNDAVQAAIAFSFFSIPAFAGLTILAVMNARKGVGDVFLFNRNSNDTNVVPSSTPISVPGVTEDSFLPMPFSGSVQNGNKGLPQGDDAVLRVDSGVPRGDSGVSQGHSNPPHGDSNPPQGDSNLPQGNCTVPRGDSGPPQGDSVFTPPQY
ncbi:Synaptogyrin-1 [Lamellibrachia satsuma]|nr:Synaptogyrin-1 [Lamellibrachia satsuma]